MNSEKLLIIGCGDLGRRLARRLDNLPYQCVGLRRHPADDSADLHYLAADATDAAALSRVVASNYDVIVITMTPAERSDDGYREAYVHTSQHLLAALKSRQCTPRLVIFASSTGVYGQNDGSWVDEVSPTRPESFTGRRMLEAEQVWRSSGLPHCILRFSGIYGPGRNRLIDQVRAGRPASNAGFTNRIHADDCAGVMAHIIESQREGATVPSLLLASDCAPAPAEEVSAWLAQRMGLPPPPAGESTIHSNKRCRNHWLLALGYRFIYPDYQTGYAAILSAR